MSSAASSPSASPCETLLRDALESGLLRAVDYELLLALIRLFQIPPTAHPHGALALALTSAALEKGHVCLDLERLDEIYPPPADADPLPREFRKNVASDKGRRRIFADWLPVVSQSPMADAPPPVPFVLEDSRLQLRRYYDYERATAAHFVSSVSAPPQTVSQADDFRLAALPLNAEQRAAARMALQRRLLIITGGPGTGKTYTLAQILCLLATSPQNASKQNAPASETLPLRILLAAPTGKAAARMYESIQTAIAAGKFPPFANEIPQSRTLDSLLGYIPNSPYFRHNAQNPLPVDILIVDEVSMLDLAKMAKLLDALPPSARLILLGDQHQLSAVAPGSVLSEICNSPIFAPCVARLSESRRFPPESLIGRLSASINHAQTDADADESLKIAAPILRTPPSSIHDSESALYDEIREGYRPLLAAKTPAEAFAALDTFRILCATREGNGSVAEMNSVTARALTPLGLRPNAGAFYPFRVLIITRNDPATGLYNGDVGVVFPDPDAAPDASPVVWFPPAATDGDPSYRKISCHLLPDHETAYAITIHKSQGSEFDNVLIHLPPRPVPVLCKELLYTALTRARKTVSIYANKSVFLDAVLQRPVRHCALAHRIAEASSPHAQ